MNIHELSHSSPRRERRISPVVKAAAAATTAAALLTATPGIGENGQAFQVSAAIIHPPLCVDNNPHDFSVGIDTSPGYDATIVQVGNGSSCAGLTDFSVYRETYSLQDVAEGKVTYKQWEQGTKLTERVVLFTVPGQFLHDVFVRKDPTGCKDYVAASVHRLGAPRPTMVLKEYGSFIAGKETQGPLCTSV